MSLSEVLAAALVGAALADPLADPEASHPSMAPSAMIGAFAPPTGPAIAEAVLDAEMSAHQTVPFWRGKASSPLHPHHFSTTMVGSSPYDARPRRTVVPFAPIIVRLHFSDGTVLDPTQPGVCDPAPPATRFLNSPLFNPASFTSNGVNVSAGVRGGTQLASAFQRANYWSAVQGTQYGVTLRQEGAPVVVDVVAPRGSQVVSVMAQCPSGPVTTSFGLVDLASFQSIVQNLMGRHVRPDQLGVVMTYNLAWTQRGCCIIGFHGAVPAPGGTQTYAAAVYPDPGIFQSPQGLADIYAWAHEIGEWVDDPFYQADVAGGGENDETPPWGHVNQVTGCQSDLEVGDPLNGAGVFEVQGAGGYLYHYQDLAFRDWFYRTPSIGTGGLYSFQGLFTTDAGPRCMKSGS